MQTSLTSNRSSWQQCCTCYFDPKTCVWLFKVIFEHILTILFPWKLTFWATRERAGTRRPRGGVSCWEGGLSTTSGRGHQSRSLQRDESSRRGHTSRVVKHPEADKTVLQHTYTHTYKTQSDSHVTYTHNGFWTITQYILQGRNTHIYTLRPSHSTHLTVSHTHTQTQNVFAFYQIGAKTIWDTWQTSSSEARWRGHAIQKPWWKPRLCFSMCLFFIRSVKSDVVVSSVLGDSVFTFKGIQDQWKQQC